LAFGRWLVLGVLLFTTAGCGSETANPSTKIERTFVVDWHEKSASVNLRYTASRVAFHDGRWSVDVGVTNETGHPLYEAIWSPAPGDFTWEGPGLAYSGLDVLGNRRLIFVPADREQPAIPFPLEPGATWRGTVSGKVPATPPLPRGRAIWFRYPVFALDSPDAAKVHWISDRSVQL
jgi:hypothetical protein